MFTLNLFLILLVVFCLGAIVRKLIQRKDLHDKQLNNPTNELVPMEEMQAYCNRNNLTLNQPLQLGRGITRKEVKDLPKGFTPIIKSY